MVLSQLIRAGVIGLKTFSKYEAKTYTKLYGYPRGRGVRHGLAGGAAVGSFIGQGDSLLDDGAISQTAVNEANKSNQARNRRFGNSGSKYKSSTNYGSNKRYSCTCKHRRMRNR